MKIDIYVYSDNGNRFNGIFYVDFMSGIFFLFLLCLNTIKIKLKENVKFSKKPGFLGTGTVKQHAYVLILYGILFFYFNDLRVGRNEIFNLEIRTTLQYTINIYLQNSIYNVLTPIIDSFFLGLEFDISNSAGGLHSSQLHFCLAL